MVPLVSDLVISGDTLILILVVLAILVLVLWIIGRWPWPRS